jgi:hypothetical protein
VAAAAAAPTYLDAQPASPPSAASLEPAAGAPRDDRYATLAATPLPASMPQAPPAIPAAATSGSSAAFATAWADAHDKLTAARYAEALAALSVWYDDPSLGLEESQKLEDLLGQLAGTVVYSQQDLLLPPHIVSPGETLAAIAAPLGVSPRLLAKINGVADAQQLMPGEHLKLLRGPFDAVVSISRRRLSLQLNGSYAGSFPVVVGRQFLGRVGGAIPVTEVRLGSEPQAKPAILLGEGLVIEAAEDPGIASENTPDTSLVVSVRDLHELLDILGPGSRILVRQ